METWGIPHMSNWRELGAYDGRLVTGAKEVGIGGGKGLKRVRRFKESEGTAGTGTGGAATTTVT